MLIRPLLPLAMSFTILMGTVFSQSAGVADGPAFTADMQLQFPTKYREWVYLASGVNMSYNLKEEASDHSTFNTVFVNPSSYRQFLKTGTWPNGTALVLENRGAVHGGEHQASINKHGLTQTDELMGLEVHVKDASLPGGWGFYSFDNDKSARIIPQAASCYSCHQQHAAVDTTFVQFYPTLISIAQGKGTLSKAYLDEITKSAK